MANFRTFENQLKSYLNGRIRNPNDAPALMRKYNNIRFAMDHKKYDRPHFIVRLGISEATFDIDSGIMISGGLGQETSEIRNWIGKYLKKTEMKAIWQSEYKAYQLQKENEERMAELAKQKKENNQQ